eukprot:Nk52_evm18s559 gene=Nk52_evmTU18s559
MSRCIVLAVDGSLHSNYALEWYSKNCHQKGDELYVLFVNQTSEEASSTLTSIFQHSNIWSDMVESARKKAETVVQDIDKRAASLGIRVHSHITNGEPRHVIVDYVKEKKADILIMGSRGAGVNKAIYVGSVSSHCINHAPCTVIATKTPKGFEGFEGLAGQS